MEKRKLLKRIKHGDVILEFSEGNDNSLKRVDAKDGFIVEKGEGVNTHTLIGLKDCDVFVGKNGEMEIRVKGNGTITHQEHGPQVLPKRTLTKKKEFDYDAEANEMRKTLD